MKEAKRVRIDAYCESDPRSVAAMLRGTGDGREKLFEMYTRKALLRNPHLTGEDLTRMYEYDARDMGVVSQLKALVAISNVGYHLIGVGVVFAVLNHFFG